MSPFPLIAFLFLALPLVEILLFIQVGGLIGAWPTIALVVLTTAVGVLVLRWQGFVAFTQVQHGLARGELPARELLEGVLLMLGGALLLIPGFFTDAIGLVFLLPLARRGMTAWLVSRGALFVRVSGQGPGRRPGPPPAGGRTLEGEFKKED